MAFPTTAWYVNFGDGATTGYYAITVRPQNTAVAAGVVRRQFTAPAVGNERAFVCIVAGTTANTTDATWTLTRGAKSTDGTATWQECTGQAAVNGDLTNTPAWNSSQVKNTALTLGTIIKNVAGTHLFILSTAGTAGNGAEPSWGTTAGNTTADNTCTWTCIGAVGSFTGGVVPHARLANALASTWSAAGETIYVADNHAETAPPAMGGQSTAALPNYILCHNHSANYPPTSSDLTTGATITASAALMSWTGANIYVRGIGLINTVASSSIQLGQGAGTLQRFELCPITFSGSANAGNILRFGNSGSSQGNRVILDNCVLTFNNVGQSINLFSTTLEWRNTASALGGATFPTALIAAGIGSEAWVHGVDLSAAGSGKTLVSLASTQDIRAIFERCKINASVTVASILSLTSSAILSKCDSGAVNYRDEVYGAQASLTTETTIVRTGGASDGTTQVARKLVTSANSAWAVPFECPPIAVWNETVGSAITLTLYGIWGGGAVPNNDDFWIDVEYLGSSGSPVSSRATSTKADILAANAALNSDSSSWGGSTTKFKTSVTITPQMKGYIIITPKIAKPSTTLYYDTNVGVA